MKKLLKTEIRMSVSLMEKNILPKELRYEATVDGCHPTDSGFYFMAKAVYKVLKQIKKLINIINKKVNIFRSLILLIELTENENENEIGINVELHKKGD